VNDVWCAGSSRQIAIGSSAGFALAFFFGLSLVTMTGSHGAGASASG
jgi:hypothetical protein